MELRSFTAEGGRAARCFGWAAVMVALLVAEGVLSAQEETPLRSWASSSKQALMPEPEPFATDHLSGVSAKITRWFDGKKAAVSLRFDDSSPSHILIAVPLLTKYRMVGTFLINPGRSAYKQYKQRWETEAVQGGHEFGNHTLHHRGAKDDDEADYEIGECSKYIWSLFPNKSKLVAFRRGGGTTWNIQKPMSYYEKKWHLVYDENSRGVATEGDTYIRTMEIFSNRVEQLVANGQWGTFYYHTIGMEKSLGISEAFFRQQVEYLASSQADIWFAGIAQAHKYQAERRSTVLSINNLGKEKVRINFAIQTDPVLYDEPLTVELALPASWRSSALRILDRDGRTIKTRSASQDGQPVVRFEVVPVSGAVTVTTE